MFLQKKRKFTQVRPLEPLYICLLVTTWVSLSKKKLVDLPSRPASPSGKVKWVGSGSLAVSRVSPTTFNYYRDFGACSWYFCRLYLVFGVLYFEVESMHLVFGTTMIEGNTKMFDNTMVLSRGFVACVFGTGACIYYLGACIWYLELSI